MKKVWIFFLGLMMLAAITVGAVACNKGEEETGTRVVLYDFEQSILPVGMFQDFGALDINEDAEYVHGGVRSLELRPASDGETEPLMYFPFESSVLGFDHKNGDRISEVRFWCYAPKQMTVQAGLYFTADVGKRGVSSEIALEQGWNEAVYTLDHPSLALVNDLSATYGFYLNFTADTVPASENVKLYVDDLSILVQDEDIEYTVVIPELTKQTGDVIAFNTINFGVVEQKSTGTSDWFSEFEGRDGVVALEANTDWPYYRNRTFWTAAYDKAYYEGYDFLVFRAYATGVLNAWYQIQDASPNIEYKLEFTEENSGRWVDFVLPIDTFLDNFDSFKTLGQFMTYAPSDETVYIDSIRAVNTIEENYAPEKASATEGETVSLVAAGLAEAYPDTEFTYIVNGMTVADPSTFVLGDAGTYTVVYEGVVDGKLIRGEYVFTSLIRGEELTFDNKIAEPGTKVNLVPDELNEEYGDIPFTFTVNGNRVVDPTAYTVEQEKGRYTVYFEGADADGYLYYGSYILSVGDYGDNYADVYTYDTAASAPTGGDVNKASWLASYEGAEGVLKMDVGSWDWLGYMNTDAWQPYFGADTYKAYKYLAFRVRLEGLNAGETLNAYFKVEGATAEDNAEYGLSFTANTDGWTTVLMPIDILVNNLDGFAQKTQWTFYIANRNGTSNAVLYIDSLTAVNVVEGKSVAASPGESLNLITLSGITSAEDVEFTVNGAAVSDPTAYTVEQEKGRYTVYFEGADADGYLYYGSYILSVGDYGDNYADVYTYDTAASAPTGGDVNKASWLASYEGAEGVLKMDVGSWDWLGYMNTDAWQPYFGADTYKAYKYLAFRVRLEGLNAGETLNAYFKVEGTAVEDNAQYGLRFTANTDGWTTVLMPIDILVNNLGGFAQKTQWTFSGIKENSKAVLYVDSLMAVNVVEGKSVAASPGDTLNLVNLSGITTIDGAAFTVNGAAVSDPVNYSVSARGRYTVMYISADNTQIGTFVLQVGNKDNVGADVMMFDSAASGDRPTDNDPTGLCELLPDFEGADGVLKLEASTNWPAYSYNGAFKPIFDKAVYQGYEYLEFRVYATGVLNLYFQAGGASPAVEYMLQFGNGNLDTNQWVTYRVSIETFLNNYDSFLQSGRFMAFADGVAPDADSTYVYIDSIRAVNYSEITVEDISVVVNEEFDFRSISALSEATELTVQIDGEVQQGTSFTPPAAGEYTVVITGETGTQYFRAEFIVRAAEEGMVLDFSSAGDAPTGGDVTEATYLNNYEGATGVLKMHVGIWKGYTNAAEWKPIFDSSVYEDYTHLAFRVKVEGFTGTNFKFYYKVEGSGGETAAEYVIEFTANTDGWTTIYLPIKTFADNFSGFAEKTQITFLNSPESNETQTYLYLDSICAVNYSEVTVDDMAVVLGEKVDFSSIAAFAEATELTVQIDGETQQGTAFTPTAAGEYTVVITGETSTQYIRAEFIVRAAEEGIVLDFSANGDRPTDNDPTGLCELLPDFEGADGVLKLEASTNWPAYSYNGAFKPIFDKAVYQGYEYLEFRVYATGVLNLYFQAGGASPAVEYMLQFGNGNLDTNQWVTYRVSIETFLNNYDSFLQSGRFMAFADGVAPDADSTYVYIDSIRAVNKTE